MGLTGPQIINTKTNLLQFNEGLLKVEQQSTSPKTSIFVILQTFQGNRDRVSVQTHSIDPPIYGRYFRIIPRGWRSHISMRLELYGAPWSKLFSINVIYKVKLMLRMSRFLLYHNKLRCKTFQIKRNAVMNKRIYTHESRGGTS